jgi:hypothetical protein
MFLVTLVGCDAGAPAAPAGESASVMTESGASTTTRAPASMPHRGSSAASSVASSGHDAGSSGDAARGDAADAADVHAQALPTLAALSVASEDPSRQLVPAFRPDVLDYYVQCVGHRGAPVENAFTVSAQAAGGADAGVSVTLSIETPGSGLAAADADAGGLLELVSDQAVVVTVSAGAAGSQEYWVRCLPDDFPEMQWHPHQLDGGATRSPGYYLFGTIAIPGGPRGSLVQEAGYGIVLDTNGVPVWYAYDASQGVYDVDSLAPGQVSFSPPWELVTLGGATTYLVADGPFGGPAATPDQHDLRLLPNGHYLVLDWPVEIGDLTGLWVPNGSGTTTRYGMDTSYFDCVIQEVDPSGTVYWQWSATDHFDPVLSMVVVGDGDLAGSIAEPFHCNALDVDPANGNILVSARHMGSIFYIERSSGKVLWVLGALPPTACSDAPTLVQSDDPFTAQHDARLLPGWKETCGGGSGQLSVFDDETYTTHPARAVVYDVNVAGGCDGGAGTAGPSSAARAWQYTSVFDGGVPSYTCGSFRIEADGARVIGWGQSLPAPNGLVFSEVDEAGHDLLDLVCPDRSSSYRAVKVPLSWFALEALRRGSAMP